MKLILFLWHYAIAVLFLLIPEPYMMYYILGIVCYLFLRYKTNIPLNKYYDIHPFVLGYSSIWIANIFSNMETDNVIYSFILLTYLIVLYNEKDKAEKRLQTEIAKCMLYIVAIPISAFFVMLYLFELPMVAFVVYYVCLLYGIYRNELKKEAWMFAVVICINVILLMLYAFQYVSFQWYDKGICMFLFVLIVMWSPLHAKYEKVRG